MIQSLGRIHRDFSSATILSHQTTHAMGKFPDNRDPGEELSPEVKAFQQASSLTDSTRNAYWGDIRRFLDWGGTIPATSRMVAAYLAAHGESHKSATLIRWKVSIGKAHAAQDLPDPTKTQMVRIMMKGLLKKHDAPQRQVRPLLKKQLLKVVGTMGERLKDRRDQAMLLLSFAGALRRSEVVALAFETVERVEAGVVLHLAGNMRIAIPKARGKVCPVESLERWLAESGITTGPLFQGISRHSRLTGKPLTTHGVALIVKQRVQAVGLDPALYSSHSLRSGLGISAAAEGITPEKISAQIDRKGRAAALLTADLEELFQNNAASIL
ncbi:MAG: integrase [Magnetococcales bacterium]|nr:integrase [Magnetococcales bacterium]